MKPLVVFADPEREAIDLIAPYVTTASSAYPTGPLASSVVHAQVELETGNADDYPVTERAQVRVTFHAAPGKRSAVKAAASLGMARFYAFDGNANVAGCSVLIGRSDVVTAPDTKNLMCWILVRLNLKATPLAS